MWWLQNEPQSPKRWKKWHQTCITMLFFIKEHCNYDGQATHLWLAAIMWSSSISNKPYLVITMEMAKLTKGVSHVRSRKSNNTLMHKVWSNATLRKFPIFLLNTHFSNQPHRRDPKVKTWENISDQLNISSGKKYLVLKMKISIS